jgi:hypothetical protein
MGEIFFALTIEADTSLWLNALFSTGTPLEQYELKAPRESLCDVFSQ